MLLEDNMERCIGCGSDVTAKNSYSKYPEPVQQKLDIEKKESGKKYLALLAITLIFIAILLMIGIYLSQAYILISQGEEDKAGALAQMLLSGKNTPNKSREVKDDYGTYYKYVTLKDDAGNDLFTALYPEDLSGVELKVDCARNSQVFPAVMSFVVTNEENTTQLTFTSPQHYQYIAGTGISPAQLQANVGGCVSFYDFKSVEDYLKEIIKQAYPTAKKIEAMDEASDPVSSPGLDKIVEIYDKDINNRLADMFGLPSDTQFSHVSTYKSDRILNYRIVTKEDHAVTCRFYVPVFCEVFDFSNPEQEMSGSVSDCYILTVSSFEAGSDELYDWYEDAFSLFVNNMAMSEGFINGVDNYAGDIGDSIKNGISPSVIDNAAFSELVKGAPAADEFDMAVRDFLSSGKDSVKTFKDDTYSINTSDNIKQVFFDPERELLFATGEEDEYPGDEYRELKQ
ncbi:MAG: hypothetical protein K5857_06480 [Lachnospiraceae bacterium]|nr:hypothetical protein [Lachnospiraceae bacterium]